MTGDLAVDLGHNALFMVLTLCGPPLLAALAVGILVGLLQAVTQLQDVTIGFVPRLFVVLAVLACLWPWMSERLVEYSATLYQNAASAL